MNYTVVFPNGKVMTFYILEVAKMYQICNGGVLITNKILDNPVELCDNYTCDELIGE